MKKHVKMYFIDIKSSANHAVKYVIVTEACGGYFPTEYTIIVHCSYYHLELIMSQFKFGQKRYFFAGRIHSGFTVKLYFENLLFTLKLI